MTGRIGWGAALAALMLGGCGSGSAEPRVTHGWVRLAANPGAPAAAYFTVEGGTTPATLVGVTSDLALKSEMHETMTQGPARGAMTGMAPLARVAVPARGEVAFAPGGRHVMLFDVNPGVKPGGRFVATFSFAGKFPMTEQLAVVGPGDPAPY